MKRLLLIISLVSAFFVMSAPAVDAYLGTLEIDQTIYSYGNGGEFGITPLTGPLTSVIGLYDANTTDIVSNPPVQSKPNFQTFCPETQVTFSPGSIYSYNISDWAIAGNLTPPPPDQQLTQGAAWLYYMFATGQMADYPYAGPNRQTAAGELQNTIWLLMGQNLDNGAGFFGPYEADVIAKFGSLANAEQAMTPGEFNVAILNLYNADGSPAQNQLVLTPVPIPAAVWLLGSGLVGLVGIRRRFKS
jgi:hypothetical protein